MGVSQAGKLGNPFIQKKVNAIAPIFRKHPQVLPGFGGIGHPQLTQEIERQHKERNQGKTECCGDDFQPKLAVMLFSHSFLTPKTVPYPQRTIIYLKTKPVTLSLTMSRARPLLLLKGRAQLPGLAARVLPKDSW